MHHPDDTIAAIASAPGGAARAIVRISGPRTVECLARVFRAAGGEALSAPRRPTMIPGHLDLGLSSPLPCQLYLWPGRHSYTRQPTAELHTIGSPPLADAALRRLGDAGVRLAEPGEFTLRAFLAGRIDLTQAEAVLGVIDAAGRRQLDRALAQLAGGLGGQLRTLREQLLDLVAEVEAELDFADEEIELADRRARLAELTRLDQSAAELAAQAASRDRAGEAVRLVLVGWPNVGKSSLFNRLTGDGQALISPQAGTTRDYLSATLDLEGTACELIDTAGIDTAASAGIAQAAQRVTQSQRGGADVELLCLDAGRPLNAWEIGQLAGAPPARAPADTPLARRLVVVAKTDLGQVWAPPAHAVRTSAATGEGIGELRSRLRSVALEIAADGTDMVPATAIRCRASLEAAAACLSRARMIAQLDEGDELLSAELRLALDELGRVVGAVYTDDVLDRIFSRFCIGK